MCLLALSLFGIYSIAGYLIIPEPKQEPARKKPRREKMTGALDTTVHASKISSDALDQLFRDARTHSAWLPKKVQVETLREAYELARMGPTSANS
jgi:hypothetical protein